MDAAANMIEKAIIANPTYAEAYNNLGCSLFLWLSEFFLHWAFAIHITLRDTMQDLGVVIVFVYGSSSVSWIVATHNGIGIMLGI